METPENAGARRQEQIRQREALGLPVQSRSWAPLLREFAVATVKRMVEGSVSVDDGTKLVGACERALRMLEGGSMRPGPGPGRPAKGAVARSVSDPVFAAQLAELQELVSEQGVEG